MRYLVPKTLNEALEALTKAPIAILAGGTDVYPALRDRPLTSDTLDIGCIEGLRNITKTAKGWRIGANTTWTDVIRADLPPAFDGLKLAAREIGSVQIQNTGTLVGNLCNASPAADGVPCLLTLDAGVELASANGTRTLPLSDFITGVRQTARQPDEIVTALSITEQPMSARSNFIKLGSRKYLVISIAMVACVVAVEAGKIVLARISVGSCSPVAKRLPALEAALVGLPADTAAVPIAPEHLSALVPIDDIRASAEYRIEAASELIQRCIAAALSLRAAA